MCCAVGQRGERDLGGGAVGAAERLDVVEGEPAGRERAGLVGAHDVDVAERLDGVDLLHQRAPPGDRGRPGGVGERR